MKELVIISGKGGTGKTTFTASFAALAKNAVVADCDVDAADLHLLLHPEIYYREEFRSGVTAVINQEKCTQCGKCREVCRFDAVSQDYCIDKFACEGCSVCFHLCPEHAIEMRENVCGEWYRSSTKYGPMIYAKLNPAEENSGKLVAIVRQQTKKLAEEQQKSWVLVDGSPGIGCPVISSIVGANLVLVVTEPSLSGKHDLQRVAELIAHFHIPTAVCINKSNINQAITDQIKAYCTEQGISVIGEIPYDPAVVKALIHHTPLVEFSQGDAARTLKQIWQQLEQRLNHNKSEV